MSPLAGESIRSDERLVSVVIPCHQQAHFLDDAVRSVLAQTHRPIEILVVDDGSTDNTAAIASAYPEIRCLRQDNRGVSHARNRGYAESRGGYLAFLDADDRLLPEAIETGLAILVGQPRLAFVSGQVRHIAFDGTPLATSPRAVVSHAYEELLYNCYIWMPGAVLYRRATLDSVGGFDTSFSASADHELYLRISRSLPVYDHGAMVGEYRRHGQNMTGHPDLNLRERLRVLRRERGTARREERYRRAYRRGVAFARACYGDRLVASVISELWSGAYGRAARGLRTLLRYHPRGAATVAAHVAHGAAGWVRHARPWRG
ncbi:MAG TPA: glycosyltransferase [Thermoanaerobaculia bacterium]|nr:glycosyltransferase [Thermoanaerobaculia bacterium]